MKNFDTPYTFWKQSPEFVTELCNYLQGKRVLEIFAGNGYLASVLAGEGIAIRATTLFSGHDGHHEGMYYDVEEINAINAVTRYGKQYDVLLICWPTTTEAVTKAVKLWGSEKEIIFIGEVTNLERHELGGCATDSFFEAVEFHHEFKSYQGNYIEHALVGNLNK